MYHDFIINDYMICQFKEVNTEYDFRKAGETYLACIQDEDSEAVLAADFEIGHFIRERIVPRAVLYFTGEAIEDDDDDVSVDGETLIWPDLLQTWLH